MSKESDYTFGYMEVSCDAPGCTDHEQLEGMDNYPPSYSQANQELRDMGWTARKDGMREVGRIFNPDGNYSPEPDTNDPTCRMCYKWRSYPEGQEHFGYAWWRRCKPTCTHEHHKDEVWMAVAHPAPATKSDKE